MIKIDVRHNGATTEVHIDLDELHGHGRAVCRPTDVYSGAIGENIAAGRALQDLGRQVEAQAMEATISQADFDRAVAILFGG